MTTTAGWPEPPRDGSEAETLVGSLERQRATFAYKCEGLTAQQLRRRVGASELTIGGLLKHLAYMEDINVTGELAGSPLPEPWASMQDDGRGDLVWSSAADDSAESLYAGWQAAVERSRAVVRAALERGGPGATYEPSPGRVYSLRRLLVDLIEEYARHTGHADLIREAVDGRVGEAPPGQPHELVLP